MLKFITRFTILFFACLILFISTSQALAVNLNKWPMFGFSSSHKRVNPYEQVINTSNVSGLTLDWTVTTGGFIQSLDTIISNGIAYFTSSDNKLYAINATTGAVLWSETLGSFFANSSPAVANGVLYIEAGETNAPYTSLYALNAKTGAILWVTMGVGPSSSPTIVHEVLYAGGSNNIFYAIDAKTGAILWSDTLSNVPNYIIDSPAVVNGVVYVAINGGTTATMYALNAATGSTIWTAPLGAESDSSPAVSNGFVYIGAGDGLLYAFDAAAGNLKWTSSNIGNVIASPAVSDGFVYIGGNGIHNHKVFALKAKTGAVVWTARTADNVVASATIANGIVYDSSVNGSVYAINAVTGAILWVGTAGSGGGSLSNPDIVNGIIYVGGSDNKFYSFHLPNL